MTMATHPFVPEINGLLHEPARLRILVLLAMVENADFMYVLRKTALSRGNLSVQMSKLEAGGVIQVDRQLVGTRPRSTYSLSDQGIELLREYKRTMLGLLTPFPN